MPINGQKPALIFDAFARFSHQEPLVIGWPRVALNPERRTHLEHLAANLGYLGRAESWVEAAVIEWDGLDANALPSKKGGNIDGGTGSSDASRSRLIPLYAPLSPEAYQETRERLIRGERERRRDDWTKKSKRTAKAVYDEMEDLLVTLPERLSGALAVETSDLHAIGWSDPPAMRRVLYSAPEPATSWRGRRQPRTLRERPDPTVARFVLAGRPRPRVEETLRIGEIIRLATMAKFG
jgi:CRISPR-associated protein Csb2